MLAFTTSMKKWKQQYEEGVFKEVADIFRICCN